MPESTAPLDANRANGRIDAPARPASEQTLNDALASHYPVAVIGGGQAGLAVGFYLQRAGLAPGSDFVVLDAADRPGGAWQQMWNGLRLFSPSSFSSLPGWMMPTWDDRAHGYPPRDHVIDYLSRYEERYHLAVRRPHHVSAVEPTPGSSLGLSTGLARLTADLVVSATGTWEKPFWPAYPGMAEFTGTQLHAHDYRRPEHFGDQHVVIVGGGNSAAQILSEISQVARTTWVTLRPPRFLPDDVDGRDLFAAATARVRAVQAGEDHVGVQGLGDIVMVPSVREARDRGALKAHPMFSRLSRTGVTWPDGSTAPADAIIWCTGFRPNLRHLRPLGLRQADGRIATTGPSQSRATEDGRLYLAGYGDWTGAASATLIGAGRSARDTVKDVLDQLA